MISRIIDEIFTYSKETKTLIGVRRSNADEDLWVGYIVAYNESLFVLQHISPLGQEDGLVVEQIDNIENFETEDAYIRSIQHLFDQKSPLAAQTVKHIEISEAENWLYELLRTEFYKGKLVGVEVNLEEIINYGFVLDYDDSSLQLTIINREGEPDGTQVYRLADISSITTDRIEARKREALFAMKKKGKSRRK